MSNWPKYIVVETSTGKYRIQGDYGNGDVLMVGGAFSRRFCFSSKENAEKQANTWNEETKRCIEIEKKWDEEAKINETEEKEMTK